MIYYSPNGTFPDETIKNGDVLFYNQSFYLLRKHQPTITRVRPCSHLMIACNNSEIYEYNGSFLMIHGILNDPYDYSPYIKNSIIIEKFNKMVRGFTHQDPTKFYEGSYSFIYLSNKKKVYFGNMGYPIYISDDGTITTNKDFCLPKNKSILINNGKYGTINHKVEIVYG